MATKYKIKGSLTCAVVDCSSSEYNLEKWRECICLQHKIKRRDCPCPEPFKLHPFPSEKKRLEMRNKWKLMISRSSPTKPGKLWTIKPKERVCSKHFYDSGEPTYEHPLPTLNLSYDSTERQKKLSDTSCRKKLNYSFSQQTSSTSSYLTPSSASTTTTNNINNFFQTNNNNKSNINNFSSSTTNILSSTPKTSHPNNIDIATSASTSASPDNASEILRLQLIINSLTVNNASLEQEKKASFANH